MGRKRVASSGAVAVSAPSRPPIVPPDPAMPTTRTFRLFVAIRELWRDRRRWVLAGVVLSAAVTFFATAGTQQWTATTDAFVDSATSVAGDGLNPVDPLQLHSGVYTNILVSQAGVDAIERASGVPAHQIIVANLGGLNSTRQSYSLASNTTAPYILKLAASDLAPEVVITANAPTAPHAASLARGAVRGLSLYLSSLGDNGTLSSQAAIRQLGAPRLTSTGGRSGPLVLLLTFVVVLSVWCALIRLLERVREFQRATAGSSPISSGGSGADRPLDLRRALVDQEPSLRAYPQAETGGKPR